MYTFLFISEQSGRISEGYETEYTHSYSSVTYHQKNSAKAFYQGYYSKKISPWLGVRTLKFILPARSALGRDDH